MGADRPNKEPRRARVGPSPRILGAFWTVYREANAWRARCLLDAAAPVLARAEPAPLPAGDGAESAVASLAECFAIWYAKRLLLRPIFAAYWRLFLGLFSLRVFGHALNLVEPLLLKRLLLFQEELAQDMGSVEVDEQGLIPAPQPSRGPSASYGLAICAALFALSFVRLVTSTQQNLWDARARLRVSNGLQSFVGGRVLGSRRTAGDDGEDPAVAYNILSTDVAAVAQAPLSMLDAWLWPYRVGTTALLLWDQVGSAFLPGSLAVIFLGFVNLLLQWRLGRLRAIWMAYRDERLVLCGDTFAEARAWRLLGWSDAVAGRVHAARGRELRAMAWMESMSMTSQGVSYVTGHIVSLVTIWATADKQLRKASVILPVLGLLGSLRGPLDNIPGWLREWLVYRNASQRVSSCIFGRNMPPPAEARSSLAVPAKGTLLLVSGESAADRTRLLHDMFENQVSSSSCVAFCPQKTWLRTTSIRNNITLGSDYDSAAFAAALGTCVLDEDLAKWPEGHHTVVDMHTVSGGQMRRIGLARAVYHCLLEPNGVHKVPAVCILDDPFISLDPTVAERVASKLVAKEGILRHVPVVIAMSNPQSLLHVVPKGTPVKVVLAGPGGSFSDAPSTAAPEAGRSSWFARTFGKAPISAKGKDPYDAKGRVDDVTSSPAPGAGRAAVEHDVTFGAVKSSIYFLYIRLVGIRTMLSLVLAIGGIMGMQQMADLWLSYWLEEARSTHFLHGYLTEGSALRQLLPLGFDSAEGGVRVYAVLVAFFVMFNFSGFWVEVIGGIRAAGSMFRNSLAGVLARPAWWWDANPAGRVLNRFTGDVQVVDETITRIIGVIMGALLFFGGHVSLLAVANPGTLLVLPVVLYLYSGVARRFRQGVRELHRMALERNSPLCHTLLELSSGKGVIHAYGQAHAMQQEVCEVVEAANTAAFARTQVTLWLDVRLQLLGFYFQVVTTLSPIMQWAGILQASSASLVGFAVAYSQGLAGILNQLAHNVSDLEMQLISVERLVAFAGSHGQSLLPAGAYQEPPTLASKLGGNDHSGMLIFQKVAIRYRPKLPPVLNGVSFSLRSGERVVVTGRTGSGKSALLLAPLHAIAVEGAIWLDGTNLRDLAFARQKIAIVPQRPALFRGSIRENLDLTLLAQNKALWAVLDTVGLLRKVMQHADGLDAIVSTTTSAAMDFGDSSGAQLLLSLPEAQSLCAARAFLRRPRLLCLDEITAGLSPSAAQELTAQVKAWMCNGGDSESPAALLATHDHAAVHGFSPHAVLRVLDGKVMSAKADEALVL